MEGGSDMQQQHRQDAVSSECAGGENSPSYWWSVCWGCVALASGTKEIYLTLLGETLKFS